jgi:hypothetical protein
MSRSSDRYERKVDATIKKMMADLDTADIDQIVKAIDAKMMFSISSDADANNHRLDAARMLLALRKRIEADGQNWWKWHKDHFARSKRDAQRLLAIAVADDPPAAAAEAAKLNAEHQATHRAKGATYISHPCERGAARDHAHREDGPVADPKPATDHADIYKQVGYWVDRSTELTQDYVEQLNAWLVTKPKLPGDAAMVLADALLLCAESFERVGRSVEAKFGREKRAQRAEARAGGGVAS